MRRDEGFRPFKLWFPWLVPTIVVTTVVMFIITMFVNDCPKNSVSCLARFLGRLSFQPFKENPLLGPSSDTLTKMGALDVTLVVDRHQVWRLLSSIWLHAGVFHLLANMLSLVFIGLRLEQEFGFVRIGLLYLISGFGGNLLSALFIQFTISVGASGALFGLLGAMLSELVTNWTIYDNKLATFLTLIVIIVINLAMGLLPHIDNFAHIGGFLSGFLLGFMLLIRPQFGWISQKHAHPRSIIISSARPKYKPYQFALWISSALLLTTCLTVALIMLLRGVNGNDHCSWCHYLSCFPTSKWSCNSKLLLCKSVQFGGKFNLTCLSNGRSRVYPMTDDKSSQVRQLCSQLCG